MAKNAEQLLLEAQTAPTVRMTLAYYCTNCPWWTHRVEDLIKTDTTSRLCCKKCSTAVRFFPLDVWLMAHKEDLKHADYEKFMACCEDNWDPEKQAQDPQP